MKTTPKKPPEKAAARKPRRKRRKSPRLTKALRSVRFAILFFLVPMVVGVSFGGFFAFARGVPSIEDLKQEVSPPSTKIYADDDVLIGEIKVQKGTPISLETMPRELLDAVVAVEDSSFWTHSGVDYFAIVRAGVKDILKRELAEGGSTITQQLAKMSFLTPEKKFRRKLKEMVLARRIESNLKKEEILTLYLNRAYYGHGAYGVEMAAKTYFGKTVADLGLQEAALIAGLLKAPSRYSPFSNLERAKARQEVVLKRMEEEGFISMQQYEEAKAAPLFLVKPENDELTFSYFIEYVKQYLIDKYGAETVYKGGLRVYTTLDRAAQIKAQHSVQRGLLDYEQRRGFRGPIEHKDLEVKVEGREEGQEKGQKEGQEERLAQFKLNPMKVGDVLRGTVLEVQDKTARIRTDLGEGTLNVNDALWAKKTYDPETGKEKWFTEFTLKKILTPGDVILVGVKSVPKEGSKKLPSLTLEQEADAQGALVAMEPYSGYIRALVGGYDFNKSEYNRALYAKRQVGSAFKPFVYAMALEQGLTPATIIVDEEITFENEVPEGNKDQQEGGIDEPEIPKFWTPQNYENTFHGPTRLRVALANSMNVITVKLVDTLGIGKLIQFARKMGVASDLPRDLTIALGSMSMTPLELTQAYGAFANGGVKMKPIGIKYITNRRGKVIESNEPEGERVMDPQTAFLMTSMLKGVVEHGTGWRARALGVPTAGKTGTTNDYRDAWFMGFTADMITGVWVGFDEPRPLGDQETGSRAAAPIWVDYMLSQTDRSDPKDFTMPDGIVTRLIDPETGLLANMWTSNAFVEYFKEGSEPKDYAPSIWDSGTRDNQFF